MRQVVTVGLDIAKDVFQAHGADTDGVTVFNRRLSRSEVLRFFKKLPHCIVGLEACSTSNHWARSIAECGHEVRLIHAAYVKPFVKRDKTDANDAQAINEAMTRKTMWFVPVKTAEQQSIITLFRARTLFVRQRVKSVTALRSHLAEFGTVANRGKASARALIDLVKGENSSEFPEAALFAFRLIAEEIEALTVRIEKIEREIQKRVKEDDELRRLQTIPGVGPITATAIRSFVSDPRFFKSARHFASWVGVTPRSFSSGGRDILGGISRRGNQQLRSLLVTGAMSVLQKVKDGKSWISRVKKRRPFKVAAVALANKMCRIVWSLLVKGGSYHSHLDRAEKA